MRTSDVLTYNLQPTYAQLSMTEITRLFYAL